MALQPEKVLIVSFEVVLGRVAEEDMMNLPLGHVLPLSPVWLS